MVTDNEEAKEDHPTYDSIWEAEVDGLAIILGMVDVGFCAWLEFVQD